MFQHGDGPEYDYYYRIDLKGDSGVGKTNLLSRFTRNEFSFERVPLYHLEFDTKILEVDGKQIKLQVWDNPRSGQFSLGYLICYDISNRESFINVQKYLNIVRESHPSDVKVMLIGNKSDLRHLREVSLEEAKRFADDNGLFFMETSALDRINVEHAFFTLAQAILQPVHLKNKAERLQKEIDSLIQIRNQIINEPLRIYQSQGKKFGLFTKNAERHTTLLNLQSHIQPILDKGEISGLTNHEKISIAQHILQAINETQESHSQGSFLGACGITNSRLAIALQQSLDGFLDANGLALSDVVNTDLNDVSSTFILM